MVLVAHVTDTHLGYRQYNLEERERDLYNLFNEVIEKILEERPTLVIHTGDFFDSPRPPNDALLSVYRGLKKLKEKGINVYAVMGDHDIPKRSGSPPHMLFRELGLIHVIGYDLRDYNSCFTSLKLSNIEMLLAGVRNTPKRARTLLLSILKRLDEEAKKYKRSILMLHQGIKEHFPFDHELELKELPRSFTYYALGHIHRRMIFRLHRGIAGYASSIDVIRVDEWDDYVKNGKGFYLIDLSGDEPIVHKVNLENIRPHIILEVSYSELEKKIPDIVTMITKQSMKPILHLTIKGINIDKSRVYRLIHRYIVGKVLTWRPRFEDMREEIIRREELVRERLDLEDLLKQLLKREDEVSLALAIYEALSEGDTSKAIAIINEFIGVKE